MLIDKPTNLPVLTGLRFIAAFSVLLAHAMHAVFKDSPHVHQVALQMAYLGLTLFFILSGTVLTINYGQSFINAPTKTFYKFWVARFARLYPLYIFFILIYLVWVPFSPELIYKVLPYDLLLVQTWAYSFVGITAPRGLYFFPYAWSVSVEWFFYLLFPLLVWALMKSRHKIIDLLVFAIIYVTTIITLLSTFHTVTNSSNAIWHGLNIVSQVQFLQWIAYYSPYSHISSFILGCIIGKYSLLHNSLPKSKSMATKIDTFKKNIMTWVALIMIFSLFFITPPDSQHPLTAWDLPKHGMLYAPLIGLFVYSIATSQSSISILLSNKFFQFFGETSYSIYLLHPMLAGLLGTPGLYSLCIIILLTLVTSYGTYSLIEVPGRIWLRKKMSPKAVVAFPAINYEQPTSQRI